MKKILKAFIFTFAIALAISVFAISASASGEDFTVAIDFGGELTETSVKSLPSYSVGDYLEYRDGDFRASYRVSAVSQTGNTLNVVLDTSDARYYEITDAAGKVSYVTKSDFAEGELGAKFIADMNALESGSTLKLLSDVRVKASSVSIVGKTLYLDLNGFNLIFANEACGMASAFGINTSSFYLYSSRPGANLFHASPMASYTETVDDDGNVTSSTITQLGIASYAVFEAGTKAKIYLGAHDGHDGDNISIFANILVNAIGSYAADEYAITIDGGYYNRYAAYKMSGMFYMRDSSYPTGYFNVSAKNATFNARSRTFYCYSSASDPAGTKQFRIDAESCVFAGGVAADYEPMYAGRMQANFEACYFLSDPGKSEIVNLGNGCHFVTPFERSLDEGIEFVKSSERKTISLKTNSFVFENFTYGGYTLDKNNNKVHKILAELSLSSLDVTDNTAVYYFNRASADESAYSLISWVDKDGNVTVEKWLNGSTPVPAVPLPEGTDACYYTYGKIDAANGDRTYVAKPIARFGLKINLTLSDDLIYNVYVPESAIEGIKEVRVKNSIGESKVIERGEMATINDVPYYRYSFNIKAAAAADAFSFDMDIYTDSTKVEYFTQENEMSIPSYAAPIIYNDKYSDATHDLMNKVLAYVKAACDYFETSSNNKYYSVIGKIESVKAPTYRAGEARPSIPDESDVKGVLGGVSVIFGSQLKYRFYINSLTDFSANTVKISHVVNGNVQIDVITAEKLCTDDYGKYFDVPLRASDMRSDVIFTVNDDSYTYNLSNYIFKVNQGTDNNAKQLVYSLWEYSEAAGRFKNEMPEIDVTINGTPISDYKLVANTEAEIAAAEAFKSVIAEEYGIELEILSAFDGKAIRFETVSPDTSYDYLANVVGDDLVIECPFRSFFEEATKTYVNDVFCNSNHDIDIAKGHKAIYSYKKILYSDFDVPTYNGTAEDFKDKTAEEIKAIGAKDAFIALQYAHAIANKKGYDVYAEPGKVYYIRDTINALGNSATIEIKTNTYWQGAKFIIDDSHVSPNVDTRNSAAHVFTISHSYGRVALTELAASLREAGGFSRDIKKLDTGLGYPAMLLVNNESATHFIRFTTTTGKASSFDENGNPAGQMQHEYVIVDAEGNIDPSTPFLFDYTSVSSIYAYRIDDTPIVLDGGDGCTVTTLSSMVPLGEGEYKNISRNLYVTRCNVTVKNVAHVIYNEPTVEKTGHTYSGFLYAGIAYNVEFNNCVVQSRVRCVEGTYDIGVYNAVDVRFINCTQSNFYEENGTVPNTGKTWYVMGSNFCKNLTYDGCVLTRFDAHCGVYNATVKNSVISSIRLTGGGHFLMENTTIVARRAVDIGFIELREDYGSTWRGTIELKNCTYKNAYATTKDTIALISAIWVNHDFGYEIYLPNVIVDNLKFDSALSTIKNVEIFAITNGSFLDNAVSTAPNGTNDELDADGNRIPDFEEGLVSEDYRQSTLYHTDGSTKENLNPYTAPEFIIIRNDYAKKNYVVPTHVMLSETSFKKSPLPFTDFDTPVIEYFISK